MTRGVGGLGTLGYFGLPTYGQGFYRGVLGNVTSTGTNPPTSGPAPADMQGPSGHLSPDQFADSPGVFDVGAAGDAGAADASSGATGGAPS